MSDVLQYGLEGSGNAGDLLVAVVVLVGVLLAVLVLGRIFDTYVVDIWRRE